MVGRCSVPDGFPQPGLAALHFVTYLHRATTLHPATPLHPAKAMTPAQRRQLAPDAPADTVTGLARQHDVSRKFVYRQAAKAEEALDADSTYCYLLSSRKNDLH